MLGLLLSVLITLIRAFITPFTLWHFAVRRRVATCVPNGARCLVRLRVIGRAGSVIVGERAKGRGLWASMGCSDQSRSPSTAPLPPTVITLIPQA